MKKSFMNNLKNFVDSNVRHRIDKVTQNSVHNSDPLSDDLLLVERHFEGLRQFCVDTEKKISAMLQSIQASSAPSQLGAYTQNVQAGLNSISHNLAQQSFILTGSPSLSGNQGTDTNARSNDCKSPSVSNLGSDTSPSPCSINSSPANDEHNVIPTQADQEFCINIPNELNHDTLQKFKKLPIVGLYKSLCKSSDKLKQDSLLATTLEHCTKMQAQLTNLYLIYEQMIDTQCLKPVQQMLEVDIPNVQKLKKQYIRAHHDLESIKVKYNGASQKQQQLLQSGNSTNSSYLVTQGGAQSNVFKLEQLKNELDESVTRFDQAKDIYEAELFTFVCREPDLISLLKLFYRLQSRYHQQMINVIQNSIPIIDSALDRTPRKFVFGTPLSDHIHCTGRNISPVIELCVYFLNSQGLQEEGIFRIPGSSVKIKKLRNGINALFLTLMSLKELENDQKRQDGHYCIVSMHDLFKSAVGQRQPQSEMHEHQLASNALLRHSPSIDESTCDVNFSPSNQASTSKEGSCLMDVHSIAGLLKLFLRELPEPLFTYSLHDSWVNCVSNKSDPAERLDLLKNVISQLPSLNYANLRHLIKFLHKLSLCHDQNKMTPTNLAIATAPSLLWQKPNNTTQSSNQGSVPASDVQTLDQQMSSFGLSASQHAMIMEALITNADVLFPEPCDFDLSDFPNINMRSTLLRRGSARGRAVKSTSPTGLSTTSSSSFSSNASSTGATTLVRGHSRKGGSMEGLLGEGSKEVKVTLQPNMSSRSINRPASVQICRDGYSKALNNHLVSSPLQTSEPPVPTVRSQKNMGGIRATSGAPRKSLAPPVPPPTSIRHQQERLKLSTHPRWSELGIQAGPKPQPTSLRGTGTVESSISSQVGTRPSVPPPERPSMTTPDSQDGVCKDSSVGNTKTETATNLACGNHQIDSINHDSASHVENIEPESSTLSTRKTKLDDDSSFDDSDEEKGSSADSSNLSSDHSRDDGTLRRAINVVNQSPDENVISMKANQESAQPVMQTGLGQMAGAKKPAQITAKPRIPAKPLQGASSNSSQSTPL